MKITIHQPEFLPYIGFFQRLAKLDIFVILDDVGYQKNGFINRNKIKTKIGEKWITIPVKGRSPNIKISEVEIDNSKEWAKSQLLAIKENYQNAPYFNDIYPIIEGALLKEWKKIIDLDIYLIKEILNYLKINIQFKKSSELNIASQKTERLVEVCKKLGGDTYISGIGAKNYMDENLFKKSDIKIIFQEFNPIEYKQQFSDKGFLPNMSIIDLLFNEGINSVKIIK